MTRDELLKPGVTILSLLKGGMTYGQLLDAGFTRKELIQVGPWDRKVKANPKIRISRLMNHQIEEIENYSGPNYKRQLLSKQYRELVEDNFDRSCEPSVIQWYIRKWRKL